MAANSKKAEDDAASEPDNAAAVDTQHPDVDADARELGITRVDYDDSSDSDTGVARTGSRRAVNLPGRPAGNYAVRGRASSSSKATLLPAIPR